MKRALCHALKVMMKNSDTVSSTSTKQVKLNTNSVKTMPFIKQYFLNGLINIIGLNLKIIQVMTTKQIQKLQKRNV